MEKIVNIDGRNVKLKSTAAFIYQYKSQFGRDAMADLTGLFNSIDAGGEMKDNSSLDLSVMYDIIWTLAKAADKSIPPVEEWLEEFSTFDIAEVMMVAVELITATINPTVNSKKK